MVMALCADYNGLLSEVGCTYDCKLDISRCITHEDQFAFIDAIILALVGAKGRQKIHIKYSNISCQCDVDKQICPNASIFN